MTNNKKFNKVIVLGNTSWGTTLANQFAKVTDEIIVLTRTGKEADEINIDHQNKKKMGSNLIQV